MANEKESRGSRSASERQSGSKTGNTTQRRQPISRENERSRRRDDEDFESQRSDADAEGGSRQTSTAQDELGQV
jgi:hypothetical protein